MVPLFGAAYAAPNKGVTILYWFRSPKTLWNPPVNGEIQGLFKAIEFFSSAFQGNFYFQGLFKSPVYSRTFQACANPDYSVDKTGHILKILGECLLISSLPGKALRTLVDIGRLAE